MEISLAGIEQAVEGLGYRSDKTPKSRLIYALRKRYLESDAIESVHAMETDALIDSMWQLGGDAKAIKSKRRNLSSIKSSVNADLQNAYENGRNPEGITIGPLNTFVMSDSAKDKILSSFSGAVNLEGGDSLDRVSEALKIVSEYLSNLPGGLEDDKLSNLKSLVEGLTDLFKDDDGVKEIEITAKRTDAEEAAEEEVEEDALIEEEIIEEYDSGNELFEDETEIEEMIDDDLDDTETVLEEDIIEEDSDTSEFDDMEMIEVMDEDDLNDESEHVELLDEEEIVEDLEGEEEFYDENEIEEIAEDPKSDEVLYDEGEIEEIAEEDLADYEEVGEDDTENAEVMNEGDGIDETEEIEPTDNEEIIVDEDEETEVLDDDTEIEEIEEIDEAETEDFDEVIEEDDADYEEDDVVEVMDEEDISELEAEDILEDEDVLEEVDEDDIAYSEEDTEYDKETGIDDIGLPLDQLAEEALNFDEFQPDAEQKRLLAERFDGYLGAMERYYNQYIIIKKGKYTVGANDTEEDALEAREVSLQDFYIGKYCVTNALFEVFIERTGYKTTAEKLGFGYVYQGRFQKTVDPKTGISQSTWNPTHTRKKVAGATWYQPTGPGSTLHQKRNHPVVQISIRDARTFAAWTGKRLPSEIEWEASARTRSGFTFPWGNDWKEGCCNLENSGFSDTSSVDEYPSGVNEAGIGDLLGNVLEWTADECEPRYPLEKPTSFFIAKGGSWVNKEKTPLYIRTRFDVNFTANILGFRCIAD